MISLDEIESILADRREAERRSGYSRSRNGALMLEVAKIFFPAILAVGGAWLSMDHRMSSLEGEVRALTVSVNEMKAMLGIGVYREPR